MTQPTAKLNAFPVFMRVEGRVVVIVGGGDEALAKARLLGQSSAAIKIVAADRRRNSPPGSPKHGATHVEADYHARASCRRGDGVRGDRRRSARPPRLRRRARSLAFRSTPSTGRSFAISSRRRSSTARRSAWRSAPKAPRRCWRRSIRAKIDQLLSPSLGALAALAASLRDAAERLLPKGRMRRAVLERFLRRRSGARHGSRPCRRGAARQRPNCCARRRVRAWPRRAGRRRAGRGRPADAARASAC